MEVSFLVGELVVHHVWVEVEIVVVDQGASFLNFYWFEGVLFDAAQLLSLDF